MCLPYRSFFGPYLLNNVLYMQKNIYLTVDSMAQKNNSSCLHTKRNNTNPPLLKQNNHHIRSKPSQHLETMQSPCSQSSHGCFFSSSCDFNLCGNLFIYKNGLVSILKLLRLNLLSIIYFFSIIKHVGLYKTPSLRGILRTWV